MIVAATTLHSFFSPVVRSLYSYSSHFTNRSTNAHVLGSMEKVVEDMDGVRRALGSGDSKKRAAGARTISKSKSVMEVPRDVIRRLVEQLEDADVDVSHHSAGELLKAACECEQSKQYAVDSGMLPALVRLIGSICSTTPLNAQTRYLGLIGTRACTCPVDNCRMWDREFIHFPFPLLYSRDHGVAQARPNSRGKGFL